MTTSAQIDTVIIITQNMEGLADFYRRGLELQEPQAEGDDHLGFPIGEVYLGFDKAATASESYPGAVSIWFRVDDLQSTFNRFVSLGAQVKYPPTEKPWGDQLAAVFDLDGNVLGLAQR